MSNNKITHKYTEGNTKSLCVKNGDRKRGWCFTSFEDKPPEWDPKKIRYLAYEQETCPETGRKHWQGFVYFDDAKTFSTVKKVLGKTPHIEGMWGSFDSNVDYCSKEGKFVSFGDPPEQGQRIDLKNLKDDILNGKKVDEIIMDKPWLYHQYGRTLSRIEDIALRRKYRTEQTKGIWYWGETGVGKSHEAYKNFKPETHYNWKNDNGWQDGYTQQETVVINDFRGHIAYNELLQMVDKWPYEVRRRGREPMPFTSKLVIVTSSLPPEKVYHNRDEEDKIEQLLRRFVVIKLTKKESTKKEKSCPLAFGNAVSFSV